MSGQNQGQSQQGQKFNFQQISDLMNNNICSLSYTTSDGENRTARGTLNSSHIPEGKRSSTDPNANNQSNGNFTYFDMEKNDWRTFSIDRLQSIQAA